MKNTKAHEKVPKLVVRNKNGK